MGYWFFHLLNSLYGSASSGYRVTFNVPMVVFWVFFFSSLQLDFFFFFFVKLQLPIHQNHGLTGLITCSNKRRPNPGSSRTGLVTFAPSDVLESIRDYIQV